MQKKKKLFYSIEYKPDREYNRETTYLNLRKKNIKMRVEFLALIIT